MQNLRIVISVLLLSARTVLAVGSYASFTEPPLDSPNYARTYELGQTVFVQWNQSASLWPRVHLRLDPLSATNAFEYGITYAILIDNAANTGSFEWTIGENDNVTLDLIEKDPRMFFQLNDATGADSFTLDSNAFLVLGSSQNTTSTNPTSSTTTVVNAQSTTASATIASTSSPAPSPPQGLSDAGKVGVGIGVPFSLLCLGVLAYFFFKLRSKKDTRGDPEINQYRSELENAASQTHRDTVMSYWSPEQGPRQELPEK